MIQNRILIIDDDQRVCKLLHGLAAGLGFDVFAIDNPLLFEQSYFGFEPNIILLDLNMKKQDGIKLLRFLSNQKAKAHIVIISGEDPRLINSSCQLAKKFNLKIIDIFRKPFDINNIRAKLRKCYRDTDLNQNQVLQFSDIELTNAVLHENLLLFYQPIINLKSGKIECIESSLRGHDKAGNLIHPGAFLKLVEEKKFISQLTFRILEQALRDIIFLSNKYKNLSLSVNMSSNMLDNLQLPEQIVELLDSFNFNPEKITLEITPALPMHNLNRIIEVLTRLRLKGIKLSTDYIDENALYSLHKHQLPYTELKIDKKYLQPSERDKESCINVLSLIKNAMRLEMNLVATKIENLSMLHSFMKMGCHMGQGYYIGRPLSLSGFIAWLEDWDPSFIKLDTNEGMCRKNIPQLKSSIAEMEPAI